MVNVVKECPMCGKKMYIQMTDEEYEVFNTDAPIQDSLPGYNPTEREFLITGYCPDCQQMLFGNKYDSERIKEAI